MSLPMNRRAFLQASGVALALPALESLQLAVAGDGAELPSRLVFICTTLGLHPSYLWPKKAGPDYETTKYLELLKDYRQDYGTHYDD